MTEFWDLETFHYSQWTDFLAKKAVIRLSQKLNCPITHLVPGDFQANNLGSLLQHYQSFDLLTSNVLTDLLRRNFSYSWLPKNSNVLIFSPHPDDDVICAGATISKLVQNKNNVHVAYQTNGSIAVFNREVDRYLMFVESLSHVFQDNKSLAEVEEDLKSIRPDDPNCRQCPTIWSALKANIRSAEAMSAVDVLGVPRSNCHFLDLPFYKTGKVQKSPVTEDDVDIVFDLLMELKPNHIFIAGDMTDPHGTHELCYRAAIRGIQRYESIMEFNHVSHTELDKIFASSPPPHDDREHDSLDIDDDVGCPPTPFRKKKSKKSLFESEIKGIQRHDFRFGAKPLPKLHSKASVKRPLLWLYRGAWEEWSIEVADVFVALSKGDLDLKIESIFAHQSQKIVQCFQGMILGSSGRELEIVIKKRH
ncbi:hypothetical protein GEMRC1_004867 [Eukaryota sp. GEM-RC1]